ncbi:MAG TPA: S24 family peptidase, partial [Chitinophagaceae bacterium]|nr:S24 family peptidase [Chitinophagaceae bacterium]
LVLNKPATFFFRMNGDAMIDDGIFSGDILIVDRSIKASSGKVIVAILDGELMVRRLQKNFNGTELVAANKKMTGIQISAFDDRSNVWGVVTCVIHVLENRLLTHTTINKHNQNLKTEQYRILY